MSELSQSSPSRPSRAPILIFETKLSKENLLESIPYYIRRSAELDEVPVPSDDEIERLSLQYLGEGRLASAFATQFRSEVLKKLDATLVPAESRDGIDKSTLGQYETNALELALHEIGCNLIDFNVLKLSSNQKKNQVTKSLALDTILERLDNLPEISIRVEMKNGILSVITNCEQSLPEDFDKHWEISKNSSGDKFALDLASLIAEELGETAPDQGLKDKADADLGSRGLALITKAFDHQWHTADRLVYESDLKALFVEACDQLDETLAA